ncbi:MAG: NADP-dependent oxidoreductase [Pontibacterium sp.]
MKAIQLHQFGELSNLVLEDIAPPKLQSGHVIVRNQACGVNPIDWKTCSGGGASAHIGALPFTPGWECAGEIIAVAEDVKDFKVGDHVMGMLAFPKQAGGLAEQVLVNAEHLCHRPDHLPVHLAGALGIAGLTAWQAVFEHGNLLGGQSVLVLGGGGGVGHLAVQIAHVHGAKVFATASSKHHALLSGWGASCIDYHSQKLSDVLEPVDLIIDCVGGDTAKTALTSLKKDGLMVTLPSLTKEEVIAAGEEYGRKVTHFLVANEPDQLARLATLVEAGDVELILSQRYPLADVAKAYEASQTGRVQGKIVIDIG